MVDITKCEGGECSRQYLCHRFTAMADLYWQSYFMTVPLQEDGSCDQYCPNGKADKLKQRSKKLQFAPVRALK